MTSTPTDKSIDLRLVETAIDRFGRHGLDGASTREIAAAAGTTMSSITYHFGGKEGLYRAAAGHIAACMGEGMGEALASSDGALAEGAARGEAISALLAIVDRLAIMMSQAESAPWARFIVREQMDPTEGFDIIFATMGPVAHRIAALVERIAQGACSTGEARLRAIAIIGQPLAYRTARAALLRITGWRDVGPEEASAIRAVVRGHTLAILEQGFGEAGEGAGRTA
jgi:AcrR family transcriptional regulator